MENDMLDQHLVNLFSRRQDTNHAAGRAAVQNYGGPLHMELAAKVMEIDNEIDDYVAKNPALDMRAHELAAEEN